jgi:hypothetical protein
MKGEDIKGSAHRDDPVDAADDSRVGPGAGAIQDLSQYYGDIMVSYFVSRFVP